VTDEYKICRYCGKKVSLVVLHPKRHHCDICGHRTHHGCLVPSEERDVDVAPVIAGRHVCRACFREMSHKPKRRRTDGYLHVAVIADVHLASARKVLSDGVPSIRDATGFWLAKVKYNRRHTLGVLEAVRAQNPDLVIFAGDATINGTSAEIRDVNRLFAAAFSGMRVIGTPGNHDFWSARTNFGARLLDFPLQPDSYPIVHPLNSGPAIVTLCSPSPFVSLRKNARGQIGAQQLERCDAVLGRLDVTATPAIVVLHHPFRHDIGTTGSHELRDAAELDEVLGKDACVRLALAGHLHEPWECRCGRVPLVSVPSAGARREFLTLQLRRSDGKVVSIRRHTWDTRVGFQAGQLPSCRTAKRAH